MDMAQFGAVIRRSLRLIVLVTVVATLVSYVVSVNLPREYQSEARVLVGTLSDPSMDKVNAYEQLAQTYAALATTTPLLSAVETQLGLTDDPLRLALSINARAPLGQSIVRITATASSAAGAAQLADAVAAQVADLGRPSKTEPSIATIVQPASQPASQSSPLVVLNTLIAGALGLAIGIGLAVLFGMNQPRA
jgi:succinoglycan biosynthesis transport protein ExoP